MNLVADLALIAVAILLLLSALWIVRFWVKHAKDDPTVWEGEIRRLEKSDRSNPPQPGAVHFVGSSSFRNWKLLDADMAPLSVLNRGFGGSQIHDCTYHLQRIVVPYHPRAIVFYAGENDMAGVLWSRRKSPADVRLAFEKFCASTAALTRAFITSTWFQRCLTMRAIRGSMSSAGMACTSTKRATQSGLRY